MRSEASRTLKEGIDSVNTQLGAGLARGRIVGTRFWIASAGLLGVLCALMLACGYWWTGRGVSARDAPSGAGGRLAERMRGLAIPRGAREMRNPLTQSPAMLAEASRHFADHCATCHANDGSGQTWIGQNLYPKVPDMRLAATQNLTDGELYYIIHHGIRLTGMPAWGDAAMDEDSWKLVWFIRHFPALTREEEHGMQRFNPKSEADHMEEMNEERFLTGPVSATTPPPPKRQ